VHGVRLGLLAEALRSPGRLRRHVDDVSFDVEFPAVVQAAQAAFLVAAIDQGCPPVQAVLTQHAEPSLAVAEHDQVLAQQPRLDGRAVALRHLLGHAHRQPVAAHDPAHRRIALDAAKKLVLFLGQHRAPHGPSRRSTKRQIYLGG